MSRVLLYSAFLLCLCMLASASTAENKTETKQRSGRWYSENQPGAYINAGEYASPSKPYYSVDSDEDADRKDKPKFNVPTSFAEFMPDQKYSSSKVPSKSSPPPSFGDWKGYSGDADPAAWMFPADMMAMMTAMKDDGKEAGFLAKLKAEPIAVFLGIVLPLTLILAAVWPSILNFFMGGMAPPPVTTIASGDNGDNGSSRKSRKGDDPSFIVSVLEAIEKFSENMISDMDEKAGVRKEKKNA
ncbi:hypothetical protein AVEN_138945-1 [Araneus ventricosus]|uniref:Uncharacterized protein n=1 Tax=Araneus ventricosus TaxID=182803 RepID=A0A4Y2M346_ARAVE|nr:hypothetical protein AVEN_138945-1 [Araneus ventricosus]